MTQGGGTQIDPVTNLPTIPWTTDFQLATGVPVYNGGISGQTSTQIAARQTAATSKYADSVVIWAGRNNINSPATVLADIAQMVGNLGHTRYLVLGIINSTSEPTGSANYNAIISLNNSLASTYGSRYVDIRSYLVSQYNSSLAQDVIDHTNDTPPTSLHAVSDVLHLNNQGYQAVSNLIYQSLAILEPVAGTTSVITDKNISSLFASPPAIGLTTRNAGSFTTVDASTNFTSNGFQVAYVPSNRTNFIGSTFYGTGGGSLTHSTGSEGQYDLSLGESSLLRITTGHHDIGLGASALQNLTTGNQNIVIGTFGAAAATTMSNSTIVGTFAGGNTNASNLVLLGYNVYSNTPTANNKIAIGSNISDFAVGTGNTLNIGNGIFGTGFDGSGTTLSNAKTGFIDPVPTNTISLGTGNSGVITYNGTGALDNGITNYEAAKSLWVSDVFVTSTVNGGTGVIRNLSYVSGASAVTIGNISSTNAAFEVRRDNTGIPNLMAISSAGLQGAGTQNGLAVVPTINKSSGVFRGIFVSPLLTAVVAGSDLLNLGTNSAADGAGTHTTLFNVTTAGLVNATNIFTTTINNFGTTSFDGIVLANNAIANSGSPVNISPRLRLSGNVYNTSSLASVRMDVTNELRPVSSTNPTSSLFWSFQGNGGGYIDEAVLTSGGSYSVLGSIGIGTLSSPQALLQINPTTYTNSTAYSVNGFAIRVDPATYTTSAAGGTVTTAGVSTFGISTLTASNATTLTSAATLYIAGAPTAGSNVSIPNPLALLVGSGFSGFNGGLGTNGLNTTANLYVATGNGAINGFNNSQLVFAGATTVTSRIVVNSSTSTTMSIGNSYANAIIGSSPISTAASGTHALLANMVVNPIGTITQGASSVTNTAALYVAGAASATVTGANYALWVASGLSQFGYASVTTGTTVATFQNAGGTCSIVPSTSGGVSCSSDMNLKKNITLLTDNSSWSYNTNITTDNQSILAKVLALTPVNYNWNVEQGSDTKHAGFIAQEVRQVFPDLVNEDPKTHLLALNYAGIMPYAIEAIKEMNLNITSINDLTKTNSWRDALTNWFASTGNGIGDLVAKKLKAKDQICINDTCVTETQLKQVLQQQGSGNTPQTTTVISPAIIIDTPPAITQTPETPAPEVATPIVESETIETANPL
ncbi:MAG: tail fiber domain-containing protein [Candidatus Paceibacterota bacterium]